MQIEQSPIATLAQMPEAAGVGLSWHYALAHWRECRQDAWNANCEPIDVVSSPGALGWYPWVDFKNGYFGLVAVQANAVDEVPLSSLDSIKLGYEIRDELARILAENPSAAYSP